MRININMSLFWSVMLQEDVYKIKNITFFSKLFLFSVIKRR